jgi:hypothetical protein
VRLKDDPRALVVASGAAQGAAHYILDRQPARAGDDRASEREQEVGELREVDSREPAEDVEPPTADPEEPRVCR